jgi:hypothetical protein
MITLKDKTLIDFDTCTGEHYRHFITAVNRLKPKEVAKLLWINQDNLQATKGMIFRDIFFEDMKAYNAAHGVDLFEMALEYHELEIITINKEIIQMVDQKPELRQFIELHIGKTMEEYFDVPNTKQSKEMLALIQRIVEELLN